MRIDLVGGEREPLGLGGCFGGGDVARQYSLCCDQEIREPWGKRFSLSRWEVLGGVGRLITATDMGGEEMGVKGRETWASKLAPR